jgi:hypothetical protein
MEVDIFNLVTLFFAVGFSDKFTQEKHKWGNTIIYICIVFGRINV